MSSFQIVPLLARGQLQEATSKRASGQAVWSVGIQTDARSRQERLSVPLDFRTDRLLHADWGTASLLWLVNMQSLIVRNSRRPPHVIPK